MLASLLTPVRNASAYLPECAASVVAQTHDGPLEWCVFDDGSSDDTLALLDAWRVCTLRCSAKLLSPDALSRRAACVGGARRAAVRRRQRSRQRGSGLRLRAQQSRRARVCRLYAVHISRR
jgi:glycosyltransferase involved in cell wall biosynthesis